MKYNKERDASITDLSAIMQKAKDGDIELIDIVAANGIPLYDTDRYTYEVVDDKMHINDEISVVLVRLTGIIFPTSEQLRKRWWLCQYPTGEWDETRKILSETLLADRKLIWKTVNVVRMFDNGRIPLPEGYSFKIARAKELEKESDN